MAGDRRTSPGGEESLSVSDGRYRPAADCARRSWWPHSRHDFSDFVDRQFLQGGARERAGGYPEINGWTARRREVIERDAGVCALCGLQAADTASHSQEVGDLVAAHTRCLVGLGPPVIFLRDAA